MQSENNVMTYHFTRLPDAPLTRHVHFSIAHPRGINFLQSLPMGLTNDLLVSPLYLHLCHRHRHHLVTVPSSISLTIANLVTVNTWESHR